MTQRFSGYLFPPRSSARAPVTCTVDEAGQLVVTDTAGAIEISCNWTQLKPSQRVGNSARRLTFPGGEVLETGDNETVDNLEQVFRGATVASAMHRMEKLTLFTVVVLMVAGTLTFSFFKWWLPAASDSAAMALSPTLMSSIGDRSLQIMDKSFLKPSDLDEDTRQVFQEGFETLVKAADGLDQQPQLLFRSAPALGPNAFALPNGTIVLTDQIVELSTHNSQILGVLAHEISHVEERHIMRRFLRSTSIAIIIVLITGDMAELTELAIAIPTFMVEMGYSREFEHEADERAISLMTDIGENPDHLAAMFELMAERMARDCGEDCGTSWLSSHPDTSERIAFIKGAH